MRLESDRPAAAGAGLDARGLRLAVIAAEFNAPLVEQMLQGARAAWARAGGSPEGFVVWRVPGAFELPIAARQAALAGRAHAVAAFGCVIRGDTPHFDYVCAESARGIMQAGLESGVPVIFGVLTVDTVAQAEERADPFRLDKGGEAVAAAIAMVRTLGAIRDGRAS
jgi:6,7-dimethyl-8-ribityllumazine synthase